MTARSLYALLGVFLITPVLAADHPPNIVFILADDMGVGDVSHAGGKAPTPAIDRLAAEGMRFSDAHTTSSVCSPTRYGTLTGRYNWRSYLKENVLHTPDKRGPMIKPGRETVASFLQKNGYHTAVIGKWHLGLGWHYLDKPRKPEHMGEFKQAGEGWDLDYSKKVAGGPNALGFAESFIIAGSLDMVPYVYLKNDKLLSVQLFDLDSDPSEKNNLAETHPDKVNALIQLVNIAITSGRTTPGAEQKNDTPVPPLQKKLLKAYPTAKR